MDPYNLGLEMISHPTPVSMDDAGLEPATSVVLAPHFLWWAHLDLNQGPLSCEDSALTI